MDIEVEECYPVLVLTICRCTCWKKEYKLDEPLIWLSTNSCKSLHKVRGAWGDWLEKCEKKCAEKFCWHCALKCWLTCQDWFWSALQQLKKDRIYSGKYLNFSISICDSLRSPDSTFLILPVPQPQFQLGSKNRTKNTVLYGKNRMCASRSKPTILLQDGLDLEMA